ncbi:MAG: tetratricopeptide repeat protein [Nitrospinota bacterium]|jgi:tetratricopeptide (TPR) repeat protein|nr:tetratricopeptide repeat protein [Nitrospinota bacterium]
MVLSFLTVDDTLSTKPYKKRPLVPSIRTLTTLCLLGLLTLILPQCSNKDSDDYYKEGLSHIEAQDYESAERAFQSAIDKNPKDPNGYYGLGGIHNYKKKYDLAEKAFLTALRIDPTFVDAHFSLGYAYEQMGQKEKSEREYAIYRRLKKKMDQFMKEEAATR